VAVLAKMGLLSDAEAMRLSNEQAAYMVEAVNFNLQQLALTNADVRNALREQMGGSVRAVRSIISIPEPGPGEPPG
jgi:hypothetical protein